MDSKPSSIHDVEKPSTKDVEKHSVELQENPDAPKEPEYPPFKKSIVIMIAVYLAIFLVALDRTIIGTAIPRITDEFHSLGDIGWYGSAYMLTLCAFQLMFGKIYTFYSPKPVFLWAMFLFEVGSALCGAAPNSNALIVGRAIAGLGSSGIFSGGIVIIVNSIPLIRRPIFMGLAGGIFGIASVLGPILGGSFTSNVTWRWCFYMNLPIGAVVMAVVAIILKLPPSPKSNTPLLTQFKQLDPLGFFFFMPGMVCLILALQWGGSTYAWGNARIIVLLVLFVSLFAAFVAVQVWKQDTATIPSRVMKTRGIPFGFFYTICTGSTLLLMAYYLPVWFQAVKGASAYKSGVMNLPLILALVVGSISAGFAVSRVGYYAPFMIASSVIMPIGAGLISTFQTDTGHSKWIGYQVILGFGVGIGMQQASLAAQTILKGKDVPMGVSLMMLGQNLGGAISVSIGQNVLSNRLVVTLPPLPNLPASKIATVGATDLRGLVDPKALPEVLTAYNSALVSVFYIAVAFTSLSAISAFSMEWKSVKKAGVGQKPDQKSDGDAEKSDSS